jgi:hypothetical protein
VIALARPALAQKRGDSPDLEVVEVARSVDLSRGGDEFLTVTVELSGIEPGQLRTVQPLRSDFRLLAGKITFPCRWLRGGSLPEDPTRLRFTLGFSVPPRGVRGVTLLADLPKPGAQETLELKLAGLRQGKGGQTVSGPGWEVEVTGFSARPYTPPALPPEGRFFSKGGPVDVRVFRKGTDAPPTAWTLSLRTGDVALYDATLDLSGELLVEKGKGAPLLSALMRRDPSRSVEKPPYGPFVSGEFHFAAPSGANPSGAILRLRRRPARPPVVTIRKPITRIPGS